MKTTITKSIIETVIAQAVAFTNAKDENASCVFVSVTNGLMEIESTNFSESIRIKSIPTKGEGFLARCAVDGNKFLKVIKAMSSDEVMLEFGNEELIVKQGRSRFKIALMTTNTIDSIDFPKGDEIGINNSLLSSMARVSHAVDVNHPNHNIAGVLLEIGSKTVAVVGTDAKRLSAVKYEHDAGIERSLILSKRAVMSMNKLFGNQDVTAYVDDVNFTINTDTIEYTTRTINGKFPDWMRIVPREAKSTVEISAQTLNLLVSQAAIITDNAEINISNNGLTINAENRDNGQSMNAFLEVAYEGEEISFGINTCYVKDLLSASGTESVTLHFNDSTTPVLFTTGTLIEVLVPVVFSAEVKAGAVA
ncbi:MAG: DNA polymerase III subunit beta [Sulfurimonas sp.]